MLVFYAAKLIYLYIFHLFFILSLPTSRVHITSVNCAKSVRIRSYSGPYSVRIRENTEQNNFEYGNFSGGDTRYISWVST